MDGWRNTADADLTVLFTDIEGSTLMVEQAGCCWGRDWVGPLRGVRDPVGVVGVEWVAVPALVS